MTMFVEAFWLLLLLCIFNCVGATKCNFNNFDKCECSADFTRISCPKMGISNMADLDIDPAKSRLVEALNLQGNKLTGVNWTFLNGFESLQLVDLRNQEDGFFLCNETNQEHSFLLMTDCDVNSSVIAAPTASKPREMPTSSTKLISALSSSTSRIISPSTSITTTKRTTRKRYTGRIILPTKKLTTTTTTPSLPTTRNYTTTPGMSTTTEPDDVKRDLMIAVIALGCLTLVVIIICVIWCLRMVCGLRCRVCYEFFCICPKQRVQTIGQLNSEEDSMESVELFAVGDDVSKMTFIF